MKIVIITLFMVKCLVSAPTTTLGPHSVAMNFTVDMAGKQDDRQGTWGNADAYPIKVPFHPPLGYRTRILRVYGDFIAFPREGVIQQGTYTEVSWGLLTSAPEGSKRVEYAADNCFLWNQGLLNKDNSYLRMPFDTHVQDGGLLSPDNILIIQVAVSLNITGLTIHMEPTLVVVYQFEKEGME